MILDIKMIMMIMTMIISIIMTMTIIIISQLFEEFDLMRAIVCCVVCVYICYIHILTLLLRKKALPFLSHPMLLLLFLLYRASRTCYYT